jgi:transcriptional regulator of acetoin/glycerol metabolism
MAARLLGIGKTTLYRKLKEYGLAEAGESIDD